MHSDDISKWKLTRKKTLYFAAVLVSYISQSSVRKIEATLEC